MRQYIAIQFAVLVVLLGSSRFCLGQGLTDTIYLNEAEDTVEKRDAYYYMPSVVKIDSHYHYEVHYASNGKIYYKGASLDSNLNTPDGLVETYFKNGGMNYYEIYKNGKAEGYAQYYYPTGNLACEGYYKYGMRDGRWVYYDEYNGKIYKTEDFKNGCDKSVISYYSNGNKAREEFIVSGEILSKKCYAHDGSDSTYFPLNTDANFNSREDFVRFFKHNIDYPFYCRKRQITGTVGIIAYIDENGAVYCTEMVETAHKLFNTEVLRAIKKLPHLIPAKNIEGKPIKSKLYFVFEFQERGNYHYSMSNIF